MVSCTCQCAKWTRMLVRLDAPPGILQLGTGGVWSPPLSKPDRFDITQGVGDGFNTDTPVNVVIPLRYVLTENLPPDPPHTPVTPPSAAVSPRRRGQPPSLTVYTRIPKICQICNRSGRPSSPSSSNLYGDLPVWRGLWGHCSLYVRGDTTKPSSA